MKSKSLHKILRITAIVLLFIVSVNALAAGYSFITDPSGKGIGITTDYLKPSAPFSDFFIPGIVLFIVNGMLSSIVAVYGIIRSRKYPQLFIMQGCILVVWIAIQLTMVIAYHPLHLIIATIGFILIVIGLLLKKQKSASFS
jgi:hypothetical protein